MTFLFKAGIHIRKYHHGPKHQKHLNAKCIFDLCGKISRSRGQIGSNYMVWLFWTI